MNYFQLFSTIFNYFQLFLIVILRISYLFAFLVFPIPYLSVALFGFRVKMRLEPAYAAEWP